MSLALQAAADTYGCSAAWARLFFPYGPGEPADRFIPIMICGLLNGNKVACSHGRQVRDFIFVEDVADALVALLDSTAPGAFNVASGVPTTLRQVVTTIGEHLGQTELVHFGAKPAPEHDSDYVVADIARLARELGWRPRVSLTKGIELTIEAWRKQLVAL